MAARHPAPGLAAVGTFNLPWPPGALARPNRPQQLALQQRRRSCGWWAWPVARMAGPARDLDRVPNRSPFASGRRGGQGADQRVVRGFLPWVVPVTTDQGQLLAWICQQRGRQPSGARGPVALPGTSTGSPGLGGCADRRFHPIIPRPRGTGLQALAQKLAASYLAAGQGRIEQPLPWLDRARESE